MKRLIAIIILMAIATPGIAQEYQIFVDSEGCTHIIGNPTPEERTANERVNERRLKEAINAIKDEQSDKYYANLIRESWRMQSDALMVEAQIAQTNAEAQIEAAKVGGTKIMIDSSNYKTFGKNGSQDWNNGNSY